MSEVTGSFEQFRDQVLAASDIVDVVGQYVELKKAGVNLKGLCPFHNDSRPSMHVHPGKQIFKCFACGKGGDVIGFVREIERADYREALEILARRYHIEVPKFRAGGGNDQEERWHRTLREVMSLSAEFFENRLRHEHHGAAARQYLERRGVSAEMVRRFRLGLAAEDWSVLSDHLRSKGYSDRAMTEAGVAKGKQSGEGVYDYLRGRLIFPILNGRGDVVAFGGRVFGNEEPKYLNTPETAFFQKGRELYGLHLARDPLVRERRPAVLVEGYMDVVACHQAGVTTAMASMGTALTADQARLIRRYAAETVFLYDADEAGIKAILRGLEILLGAGLTVRVGRMPAGEDPDSVARKQGAAALQRVVAEAVPFFDFLLERARLAIDPASPESRVQVIEMFEPVLGAISEPLVRDGYISRLGEELGHEEGRLREFLDRRAAKRRPYREAAPAPTRVKRPLETASDEGAYEGEGETEFPDMEGEAAGADELMLGSDPPPRREVGLLQILLEHADARVSARDMLEPEWVTHPLVRYYVKAVLDLDGSVVDAWRYLMAQKLPLGHRDFLERMVVGADEPVAQDYLAVAEYLVGLLKSEFHRGESRRLHQRLRQMGDRWSESDGQRVMEEWQRTGHARIQERERALRDNPCVQVRYSD